MCDFRLTNDVQSTLMIRHDDIIAARLQILSIPFDNLYAHNAEHEVEDVLDKSTAHSHQIECQWIEL